MTATNSSNRALTLNGANKIFSAIDIEISEIETGGYQAAWREQNFKAKTLTELCQTLMKTRDQNESGFRDLVRQMCETYMKHGDSASFKLLFEKVAMEFDII